MRAVLLGAAALLACGTEPDNTPAALEPDGEAVFSGTAGLSLPQQPAVRVTTSSGKPLEGITVLFAVTQGGGSTSGSGTTDASGVARAAWTLGTTAGDNRLVASIAGITQTVTFTAFGLPGSPALLEIVAGSGQTAQIGSVLPTRPAVKVTDMFGNPNGNVRVTFAVSAGGGSIADATPVTDFSGVATAGAWTLGTTAGTQRLTATVSGAATTDILATATSGAAAQIRKTAGDQDSVVAGTAVPTPPTVKIVDAFDNAVSGVTVTFAVDAGNGSITGAQQQTNAQGLSSVGSWVLGTKAGTNTLTASAAGLSAVTFTVTGKAGPATAIALSPDTVSLSPGDTVSLSVTARDTNANLTSIPTLTWSSTNTTM